MTFQDLIKQNNKKEVMDRLAVLYPDQKKNLRGYRLVWDRLLTKRKNSSDMRIEISKATEDGETWHHTGGWKKGEDRPCWSLCFTSRSEWLGMEIHPGTLKRYSEIDIIAHSLWEMTWNGFEEKETTKKWKKLMDIGKKIEKDLI